MKSFCIKTNNTNIINYLLKKLEKSNIENIVYTSRRFKNYKNVIIHYCGNNILEFLPYLSNLITDCILFYYEPILIKNNINYNYIYFDNLEKKEIEKNCYLFMKEDIYNIEQRKKEIYNEVTSYIEKNKSMILSGFTKFHLKSYNNMIDNIIEYSVSQYVISKEYEEFISLLKMYINSNPSNCNLVHLIYCNNESILLNENKNIISLEDSIFNVKYLSDISFSSNDYALNALLTLLPKRIELHLIGPEDEFVETLKNIFEHRLFVCIDCSLCKTYKILNNIKKEI